MGKRALILAAVLGVCIHYSRSGQSIEQFNYGAERVKELHRMRGQISFTDKEVLPHTSTDLFDSRCANSYYTGRSILIDRSTQQLTIYQPVQYGDTFACQAEVVIPITSGKDGFETPAGSYWLDTPYIVEINSAEQTWWTFRREDNEFFGIHTASWQQDGDFGSLVFTMTDGSTGCVRIPVYAGDILEEYYFPGIHLLII